MFAVATVSLSTYSAGRCQLHNEVDHVFFLMYVSQTSPSNWRRPKTKSASCPFIIWIGTQRHMLLQSTLDPPKDSCFSRFRHFLWWMYRSKAVSGFDWLSSVANGIRIAKMRSVTDPMRTATKFYMRRRQRTYRTVRQGFLFQGISVSEITSLHVLLRTVMRWVLDRSRGIKKHANEGGDPNHHDEKEDFLVILQEKFLYFVSLSCLLIYNKLIVN